MKTTREQVGINLRTIRTMRGMTGRDVAKAVGRNHHHIWNLEAAKASTTIKIGELILLCELYDCTPNDIFYLHEKLGT